MHTSHWGLIATAGIVIGNSALSAICGHSVDISQLSWMGIAVSTITGSADWIHRHFASSNNAPTAVIASTNFVTPGLTPDS